MMKPHFFKIIRSSIFQNRKIRIPPEFVRKYGADFADFAVLKVQNGSVWSVEMKRDSNGGVWFHENGLNEYFEFYSILYGHSLMFRYDGNSHFHVIIFDKSASEIHYPSNNNSDDEEPAAILEGISETKIWEDDLTEDDEDYIESSRVSPPNGDDDFDDSSEEIKTSMVNKEKGKKNDSSRIRTSRALGIQARANQIANEFESKHPFFTIPLQAAYIHHIFLPIPSTFKEKEMLKKLERIRVEVPDGRSWLIGLVYNSQRREVRMSKGVAAFLSSNNLVEGDICVFEMKMKKNSEFMLKVHIFRRTKNLEDDNDAATTSGKC